MSRELRGAGAALKKLEEIQPSVEEVKQDVIQEGKDLLTTVAQAFGERVLNSVQMQEVLQAMITGTSFSGASIEEGRMSLEGRVYMSVIMGKYESGTAYNVWFEREHNAWKLKYNRIPKGGNLRG